MRKGAPNLSKRGHSTKLAAMPIYGKNLLQILTANELGMKHWVLEFYPIPSNDDPRLTFDHFQL